MPVISLTTTVVEKIRVTRLLSELTGLYAPHSTAKSQREKYEVNKSGVSVFHLRLLNHISVLLGLYFLPPGELLNSFYESHCITLHHKHTSRNIIKLPFKFSDKKFR